MPTITVNTGPLAGRKFDNLLDLMDAQDEVQKACKHVPTLRHGICGKGISKRSWTRTVCIFCNAVVTNNTFTDIPDYEEQKKMEAAFWEEFRLAEEGETPYWWTILRQVPRVGLMAIGASGALNESTARNELREQLGIKGKGLNGKLVAVVKVLKSQ